MVHASPMPVAATAAIAVNKPSQVVSPPSPRRCSERRAIAYFQPAPSTSARPATRWAKKGGPARPSGRSHATTPVPSSVAIAARSTRFASRRGIRPMLDRLGWQTAGVTERDLLIVSENPLNAETILERQTGPITLAGRHYVRTHFPIPNPRPEIAIDGAVRAPTRLSLDDVRKLPPRTIAATPECAGTGRKPSEPEAPGRHWGLGPAGAAVWTGAALRDLLEGGGRLPGRVADR